MYKTLRSLLFHLEPENAHGFTLALLRLAGGIPPINWLLRTIYSVPEKPVRAFGLTFKNPIGLAAGYDKDGVAVSGLTTLGFGHVEVGTVTPLSQNGNPRPRIFRLEEDEAIINRMGFPGKGSEYVKGKLSKLKRPLSIILGVNLGKNKDTPLEEAARDYISLIKTFNKVADYLTINISSPNTIGLRRLQGRQMLDDLLGSIAEFRMTLPRHNPILVKLAPDLESAELDDALEVILNKGMDGIVATNTTLTRPELHSLKVTEAGGLSGAPLRSLSFEMLKRIVKKVDGQIPVVSAGGVMTKNDVEQRLQEGASLVQVYTGLVYHGPGFIKHLLNG